MTELPQNLDLRSHDLAENNRQELLRPFHEIQQIPSEWGRSV